MPMYTNDFLRPKVHHSMDPGGTEESKLQEFLVVSPLSSCPATWPSLEKSLPDDKHALGATPDTATEVSPTVAFVSNDLYGMLRIHRDANTLER